MRHPFALNLSDLEVIELDFEEQVTDEEAVQIQGGTDVTTFAVGEEGGGLTTLALGEEGGIVCISAPCPGSETGGNPEPPKPPKPPKHISLPKLEDGCGPVYTKAKYGYEGGGGPIYW